MKQIFSFVAIVLFAVSATAASAQCGNCNSIKECSPTAMKMEIPVWPNGAPNSNGITEEESEYEPFRVINVTKPTITVYLPTNPNGKCIIMCPGGGYGVVCTDHEGHDMASWFNSQGIAYVVLKYRLPNGHKEVPLSDAAEAVRIMRAHGEEWNINSVGIMGGSAGGHLASTLATHYDETSRPDFQILFYPVITMHDYSHLGSRANLLGENPTEEDIDYFSNELHVTKDTPPAFIMLSDDDTVVVPKNSINYYIALNKNGVSASLHIYPTGSHGWGFLDSFIYKPNWTSELEAWLKSL